MGSSWWYRFRFTIHDIVAVVTLGDLQRWGTQTH